MCRCVVLVCACVAVWLLAAVGALAQGGAEARLELDERYLLVPAEPSYVASAVIARERQALLDVQLEESASVARQVGAAKQAAQDEAAKRVYDMLLALADESDECTESTILRFLEAYAIIKYEDEPSLAPYADYMREHGSSKFGRCATKVERESSKLQVRAEKRLDLFFTAALDEEAKPGDRAHVAEVATLYEQLKAFDLAEDKFNARAALPYAWPKAHTEQETIEKFLIEECKTLLLQTGCELQVINLARSLGSHQVSDARLLKLSEYGRICLQLMVARKTSSESVKQNIQRQLDRSTS